MRPEQLRVEHLIDPLGLDEPEPRFSWVVDSDRRGDRQSAYELCVGRDRTAVAEGRGDVWESGEVASAETVLVAYGGPALEPRQRCWWSVRVGDGEGRRSAWADPAVFELGLAQSDWQGAWIAPPVELQQPVRPPAGVDLGGWRGARPCYVRRRFRLAAPVTRGRVYVTARGLFELWINGTKVSDDVLAPGWTDYRVRQPYRTYEVTDVLRVGDNVVGALLGTGWYCGRVAWKEQVYGDRPWLLLQLEAHTATGAVAVTTDPEWEARRSPVLWADLLNGEAVDLRDDRRGWCDPDAAAGEEWQPVEHMPRDGVPLVGTVAPPVRRLLELPARGVEQPRPSTWVFDLGQNMVGWVRLALDVPAGTAVRIRHAEMLEADGTLHVANLRTAACTDVVIAGDQGAVYEPRFTFRGFRYVEVTGIDTPPPLEAVTGVVVGTDTRPTGTFGCSNPLVEQLQHNLQWSQRGNFLEVPTDCPQRDERLGWLGDAQIFVGTAAWNADIAAFWTKWLRDVRDAQTPAGAFPDVAPVIWPERFGQGAPGWGDAGVIVPWVLHERYGDVRLLERSFASMAAWIDFVAAANPDGLWRNDRGNDFGDWLEIAAETPKAVLATAYFARSADLVSRAAKVLGRAAEAARYGELGQRVRDAFCAAHVTPSGRIEGDTQTAYVLALAFDLLPAELRPSAADRLAADVAARGGHLSTGFLGVGHLLPALSEHGHLDVAYQLLENDTFPSWGYSIRHGATTIWERWDGWTAEGGFKEHGMNSFNHYALGSVGDWLFRVVGGIEPLAPGFARVGIRPRPGGSLRHAAASYASPRGQISCSWRRSDGDLEVAVRLPANVTAVIRLPGPPERIWEGDGPLDAAAGVESVAQRDGDTLINAGGGSYRFTVR